MECVRRQQLCADRGLSRPGGRPNDLRGSAYDSRLGAAQRLAGETPPERQAAGVADGSGPVGHWRRTYTSFDSAFDENLVLNADGTAEKWTAGARGRSGRATGRWSQQSGQLSVRWNDGTELSKPWSYHGNELLLRTSTERPPTWERIK